LIGQGGSYESLFLYLAFVYTNASPRFSGAQNPDRKEDQMDVINNPVNVPPNRGVEFLAEMDIL
jgi:hypothetical protein